MIPFSSLRTPIRQKHPGTFRRKYEKSSPYIRGQGEACCDGLCNNLRSSPNCGGCGGTCQGLAVCDTGQCCVPVVGPCVAPSFSDD